MSAHTPSPWKANRYRNHIRIAAHDRHRNASVRIAKVDFWSAGFGPGEAEQTANARLMAAAPDMLAALQEVSDYLDGLVDIVDGPEGEQLPNKAMSLKAEVDDIISKTEGK